ncbi:FAD binding domain-containing protein [Bacillus sp. B1-b2]|uniref:FAD binding domain-containing protein n=1 Tax=Bacillus sp. B1-b2 TaxID=2653201 RepID=UPI0012618069|nr:FAD binding domain-containing protein [Bacillus sp. B1-b2]KAB7664319.1 xanthine dehydrogenase [Bacillus sp. B1-b2]
MVEQYFRPDSLEQATFLYNEKVKEGKHPTYFAGGTEIITLSRWNQSPINVLIDIKRLPSCRLHQITEDFFVLGSAITLTEIVQENHFPLLTEITRGIADKTARNKITIGGNICGDIFYREAVLPLLLTNSALVLADHISMRTELIMDIFDQKLLLKEGELFVQAFMENRYMNEPFYSVKIRQQWETGYPLITAAAIKTNGELRVAFSGLCSFPFRSLEMEEILNNPSYNQTEKIIRAKQYIPGRILNDVEGSSEYRLFVFGYIMENILAQLGDER